MSKKNLISVFILLFLTILSVWVFFSNSPQKVEIKPQKVSVEKKPEDETVKASNLVITETKEGKKFWEVCAESGNYTKSAQQIILKNINGNFYKDNEVVLSVKAPYAIYDSVKRKVIMKNGAKAANNKNVIINAEEICWMGATGQITATGRVKIIQSDKILTTSDKSIFNSDFTNLKLIGNSNSYVYK